MRNALVRLILFGTSLVTCAGCSTYYEFAGVVLDGAGDPISGAQFGIRPYGYDMPYWEISGYETEADGKFEITHGDGTGIKHFELRTKCDGFDTDVRIIAANASDLRIVMSHAKETGNDAVHRSRRASVFATVDFTPRAR